MFYLEVMQYHHYICTSNRLYKTTTDLFNNIKKDRIEVKKSKKQ